MGTTHAVVHDEGMHQKALRPAIPPIVLLAGLVILVADFSAAFGWALVVLGAALVADRRAVPR
jgi:hypothetical protein